MTDLAGGAGGGVDIGRVIERTFGVIGRNFPVFAGLALVLAGIPQALVGLAALETSAGPGWASNLSMLGVVGGLVNLVGSFVLQAALVHGAVTDLNGRKAAFGDCLRTGLNHFLPVFAISILAAIAVTFGLILLIVPGVMLMVAWTVVVPVRVVEGAGVFASFGRSAALTRGSRWSIFGLFVIYAIIGGIVGAVIAGVATGLSLGLGGVQDRTAFSLVASPILNSLVSMVGGAGVAAVYYELRAAKEGAGPETLAAIFD